MRTPRRQARITPVRLPLCQLFESGNKFHPPRLFEVERLRQLGLAGARLLLFDTDEPHFVLQLFKADFDLSASFWIRGLSKLLVEESHSPRKVLRADGGGFKVLPRSIQPRSQLQDPTLLN